MKAWEIQDDGGYDNFRLVDKPSPRPGPGEVLVRMRASALNYRDLSTLLAPQARRAVTPLVPNSDGAGEVTATGDGVSRFAPGDRVAGCFFRHWADGAMSPQALRSDLGRELPGVLAEEVVFPEEGLVSFPGHLNFEEAATLPCAALTAWRAVVEEGGGVAAGQRVLSVGTGGVAVFALQFAVMHGAEAAIVSSSDAKLERARALGAAITVNYRTTPDWGAEIAKAGGVDRVVETGGVGTLAQSAAAARQDAWIVLMGNVADPKGAGVPPALIPKMLTLKGIRVGSRAMFERMNAAIEANEMRPVVDGTFDFAAAPDAFRALEAAGHFGKLVIRFPS